MTVESLTERWRRHLFHHLERPHVGKPLQAAALSGKLAAWTAELTSAVVETCAVMGWRAAAKGYPGKVLPVSRSEYLELDIVAFGDSSARWPFPIAIFELENSPSKDLVSYSLWKVLCVRAATRFVFAYRRDAEAGVALVSHLSQSVIGGLSIQDRTTIRGETTLIIGNPGVAETFPYGYFRAWTLDTNTGQFQRS
jgi:hypothetical protein